VVMVGQAGGRKRKLALRRLDPLVVNPKPPSPREFVSKANLISPPQWGTSPAPQAGRSLPPRRKPASSFRAKRPQLCRLVQSPPDGHLRSYITNYIHLELVACSSPVIKRSDGTASENGNLPPNDDHDGRRPRRQKNEGIPFRPPR
jgi:hypothetical protein